MKKQRGLTMVEIMIGMVIIAGAMAVILTQAQKLFANGKADAEGQHVISINNSINGYYKTARSYQTLTNTALLNAKVVPDDMKIDGTAIKNVWGGDVTVGPDAAANNQRFWIEYNGIPRLECARLATKFGVTFERLDINGTTIFDRGANGGNLEIDPATVAAECENGSANEIIFYSR